MIADAELRAAQERRSLRFTLSLLVSEVLFALAPLVPGASRFFGALSVAEVSAMLAPGPVAALVSVGLYRRLGPSSRAHQVSEVVESTLLFSGPLAIVFFAGVLGSPIWALSAFTAIFWGLTKPFWAPVYLGIILGTHGLMAAASVLRGEASLAGLSVAVGLGAALTFIVVGRRRMAQFLAQADRNVARVESYERLLETERERVARALTAEVADRLEDFVERLRARAPSGETRPHGSAASLAAHALEELRAITSGASESLLPDTIGGLARLIEQKVRPLCTEARYSQTLATEPDLSVSSATALAVIRIMQELVRNAVTHGNARTITVRLAREGTALSLSVRDDGGGLCNERFLAATGGLRNVERWVSERGGTFQRVAPRGGEGGTELRLSLPAWSASS